MDRSLTRQTSPARNWRLFAGALLCALVVLFALVAKVSWYRVHAARSSAGIASMKAFRGKLPAADVTQIAPVHPAELPALVLFAAALLLLLSNVKPEVAAEVPVRELAAFRRLSIARPPPVR